MAKSALTILYDPINWVHKLYFLLHCGFTWNTTLWPAQVRLVNLLKVSVFRVVTYKKRAIKGANMLLYGSPRAHEGSSSSVIPNTCINKE